jgi:hypothetical protein
MHRDSIEVEITEDGKVIWKTGKISAAGHSDADQLQADLEAVMGGPVQRSRTGAAPAHSHTHEHGHIHAHEGHHHGH